MGAFAKLMGVVRRNAKPQDKQVKLSDDDGRLDVARRVHWRLKRVRYDFGVQAG